MFLCENCQSRIKRMYIHNYSFVIRRYELSFHALENTDTFRPASCIVFISLSVRIHLNINNHLVSPSNKLFIYHILNPSCGRVMIYLRDSFGMLGRSSRRAAHFFLRPSFTSVCLICVGFSFHTRSHGFS